MASLRSLFSVGGISILMLGGLTACGSSGNTSGNTSSGNVALTVWHDKGSDGDKYFQELSTQYEKTHPNVKITSTSFPTDQWTDKTLSAIKTKTTPDLVFNDASRILQIEQMTNGFLDLSAVLQDAQGKEFVTQDDQTLAKFGNQLTVLPVNRTIVGLGIRTSWMKAVNASFPKTFQDFVDLGNKFKGLGKGAPFSMFLGNDPSQILNMFLIGSGHQNVWLDGTPKATFDQEPNKTLIEDVAKLYNTDGIIPTDAINQDFNQMYQVVESGKGGMFRVGNWNAAKWDGMSPLAGDYQVGPFPSMTPGDPNYYVELNVRGYAIPKDSKNSKAAEDFLKFVLSTDAQVSSFNHFGSAMRTDLTLNNLTPNQQVFMNKDIKIKAIDPYFTQFAYYNTLLSSFEKTLLKLYSSPANQSDAILADGANQVNALISQNKK